MGYSVSHCYFSFFVAGDIWSFTRSESSCRLSHSLYATTFTSFPKVSYHSQNCILLRAWKTFLPHYLAVPQFSADQLNSLKSTVFFSFYVYLSVTPMLVWIIRSTYCNRTHALISGYASFLSFSIFNYHGNLNIR